ncbi:MAG: hypothetical protein HC933_22185 [Pleurocapsa sp. SU_196_0]|nr:hypothetical protein [Pleurocapsa sp. SU_196_0]
MDGDSAELDLTDGNQLYSCLFTGRASLQNGALVGKTFYRATANGQFQDLNRSCEVRLVGSGVGPTPIGPQPVPQPPRTSTTHPATTDATRATSGVDLAPRVRRRTNLGRALPVRFVDDDLHRTGFRR